MVARIKAKDSISASFSIYTAWTFSILLHSRSVIKILNALLTIFVLNHWTKTCKLKYQSWESSQQLLEFIPPIHHTFYRDLPHDRKANRKKKKLNMNSFYNDFCYSVFFWTNFFYCYFCQNDFYFTDFQWWIIWGSYMII